MAPLLKLLQPDVHFAAPAEESAPRPAFSLAQLGGRLAELSSSRAGAQLSFALRLVREAQESGETAAWIGARSSSFFPPDAEACGIDLSALPVVRLGSAQEMGRAADQLLRSGAFGLLVVDLGGLGGPGGERARESPGAARLAAPVGAQLSAPLLTRLLGLAQKHAAAVLFLTEKPGEAPSLSSLVSLRAEVSRAQRRPGRFLCELHALKDKRRAPGWTELEEFRGPAGLR